MRHRGTRRNQRRVSSSPTLVERTPSQDARKDSWMLLPPGSWESRQIGMVLNLAGSPAIIPEETNKAGRGKY
jgi:hypothetical protein